MIKRGSTVTQIVTPIKGVVTRFQVDQETGEKLIEVTWDDNNVKRSRFFKETELQVNEE